MSKAGGGSKQMQTINLPVSSMVTNAYDVQQIQIVNTNGTTIGTVQGVMAPANSTQVQTIQLQVVDNHRPPKVTRVKTDDDNWKFIQITPERTNDDIYTTIVDNLTFISSRRVAFSCEVVLETTTANTECPS
jgi:sporulation protein YlmC with PRC-barrel domain